MSVSYLDRGKTRLNVTADIADEIGRALRSATKRIYKAEKRRRRLPSYSYHVHNDPGPSLKEVVFELLPEAIRASTDNETYFVSLRDLYYEIRRPLSNIVERELQFGYFGQKLIPFYEEDHGRITNLIRDPRGHLYEPHTGKVVPLGTRAVDEYEFPLFIYNKLVYIEKKGLMEQIMPSKLAERLDLAIVAAEGYATEAARTLLVNADTEGDYKIFVFHDADPYGYNIYYTIKEATRRMPLHSIEVIDIGLTVAEALQMGLEAESFYRTKAIPQRVEKRLTDLEREYFIGEEQGGGKTWKCQRFEINAIPVRDRVGYIERKLKEHEAPGKVVPPDAPLRKLAQDHYENILGGLVDVAISTIVGADDIKAGLLEALLDRIPFSKARQWVERGFRKDDSQSWREVVSGAIRGVLRRHRDEIEQTVRRNIEEAITEG